MSTIVSLTLSPSLDCSSTTQNIFPEGKIRCDSPKFEPGGGGINVTRVITRLGGDSLAVYPSGGSTGQHLDRLLDEEGIRTRPVGIREWTRQNLNIATRCDHQQYRFIMPGADLEKDELEKIEQVVLDEKADFLVISGSIPANVPLDFVVQLVRKCQVNSTKVAFDCSGDALTQVVEQCELFLIKPNSRELANLCGGGFSKPSDLSNNARRLIQDYRLELALVSLGAQGALLVTSDICEQIIPPRVDTQSTVGAGDSMLAALIYAISKGHTYREAARLGVAAGTAATMNQGTQLCDPQIVQDIYTWLLEEGSPL